MIGTITFAPRGCDECRERRRDLLEAFTYGMDIMLLIATISDVSRGHLARREAIALVLVIVLAIALTAYARGRLHGVRTLADKLNEARRREHEEDTTETESSEKAEAATTPEEGEANE